MPAFVPKRPLPTEQSDDGDKSYMASLKRVCTVMRRW